MKLASKPSWSRLIMDGFILLAAVLGMIYMLSLDAGASEEAESSSIEVVSETL